MKVRMPYLQLFSDQELIALYEGLKSVRVAIHSFEGRNSCPGARLVITDDGVRDEVFDRIRVIETEMKMRDSFSASPFVPFSLYYPDED